MRTTKLLATILVAGLIVSACRQDPDYVLPAIRVASTELDFSADTEQPLEFTATRDWRVRSKPDWVTVSPDQGSGSESLQRVRISVDTNPNYNRTGEVILSIGLAKASVAISQPGAKGDEANRIAFRNNFDKEVATQTYGSGTAWPYMDQFEGWKNENGTGADAVAYEFASISVRANSKSDSNYSDYAGSGDNNLFLGPVGNFLKISNIKITEKSYTLSFGSEKYLNSGDSKFSHDEFHVYVSDDGTKWVELAYAFPDGDKTGRWDLASSTFSVPDGTAALSLYFKADVASAYRLDDVTLISSDNAGTSIDFTTGISLDNGSGSGGEGGGGGGNSGTPSGTGTLADPYNAAAAAAAVANLTWTSNTEYQTTDEVYVKGKICKIADKGTYAESGTYGNASFYISDDGQTGGTEFYCYHVLYFGGEKYTSGTDIAVGNEVVIYGKLMNYRGNTPETATGSYLYSLNGKTEGGSSGGSGGGNEGGGNQTADTIFSQAFKTDGQGNFTIDNKNTQFPEGATYVWSYDNRYGMKASAYANNANFAAESWLVSPAIDLTAVTKPVLTFRHALNFFSSLDKAKEEATVWAKPEGGEWVKLSGVIYPESLSWTFVDSGEIDLSAYAGKKIQIGFKYVSTATKAGTWEVDNFEVKNK